MDRNAEVRDTERVSRRAMLAKGAALAAGVVAAGVAGGALTDKAEAADGDNVVLGNENIGNSTIVRDQNPDPRVEAVLAACGSGTGVGVGGCTNQGGEKSAGVYGKSSHASSPGVLGTSDPGVGMRGTSSEANAVEGESTGGHGVYGLSSATGKAGVFGQNGTEVGVFGTSTIGAGVKGESTSGPGVVGSSADGVGIDGTTGTGTALKATSKGTGTALQVAGTAKFSQAGRSSVARGKSYRIVTGPKVAASSAIVVTLNGDPGYGVFLKHAVRTGATSFKVQLNKTAARTVYFSYFVIN